LLSQLGSLDPPVDVTNVLFVEVRTACCFSELHQDGGSFNMGGIRGYARIIGGQSSFSAKITHVSVHCGFVATQLNFPVTSIFYVKLCGRCLAADLLMELKTYSGPKTVVPHASHVQAHDS